MLLGLLVGLVDTEDPPRLRTLLPTGAAIFAERVPESNRISMQLWVAARGAEETPETHGLRHLLEHFVARGKGRLALRVESLGGLLVARTFRDATQFEVVLPNEHLELAANCLAELLSPPVIQEDVLAKEVSILVEEEAVREPSDLASSRAWLALYGQEGLDPFGNLAVIERATPEALLALYRRQFQAPNLAVSISGDHDVDEMTRVATDLLAPLAPGTSVPWRQRQPKPFASSPDPASTAAAVVPTIREPLAVGVLAAGLSMASELPDGYFTYTPTLRYGTAVVGSRRPGVLVNTIVSSVPTQSRFILGRKLAAEWVDRKLKDPRSIAEVRGLLLVQAPGARLEDLRAAVSALTPSVFARGWRSFRVIPDSTGRQP